MTKTLLNSQEQSLILYYHLYIFVSLTTFCFIILFAKWIAMYLKECTHLLPYSTQPLKVCFTMVGVLTINFHSHRKSLEPHCSWSLATTLNPGDCYAVWPFPDSHTYETINLTVFFIWHLSLSIMFLRFLKVIRCINSVFIFIAE